MFFIILCIVIPLVQTSNEKTITIKDGTLAGTILKSRGGKLFNAFCGIPFAKPPIGDLRFQPPQSAVPWDGVLNASVPGPQCLQDDVGSEDCLTLNIYTPIHAKKGDKIPVIVYIFGGAFEGGSNYQEGPQYIMDQYVIFVDPNYRLGALGYLSTGDDVISGNFGSKDQIFAMKWTRENIEEFGGDPDYVTLQGHSSGSACVHLHTLSPLSKGLFHRAIMQSATGDASNTFFGPDVAGALAVKFATRVGCDTSSSYTILKCLRNLKAEIFPLLEDKMYVWYHDPGGVFRPTVEGKSVVGAFMPDFPHNMRYHSPHQPWLIGLTSGEGAQKVADYLTGDGSHTKEINAYSKVLFPIILEYYWNTKLEHLSYTSDTIRDYYFQDEEINENTSSQFVTMMSDGLFDYTILRAIKNYPGIRYAYMYDYEANHTTQNDLSYYPGYLGISHGAEIHVMFYRNESARDLTPNDVKFGDEMLLRWVNFVTSGNPNIPNKINRTMMSYWNPVTTKHVEYLRLKYNGTMESGLFEDRYNFWDRLPIGSKYNELRPWN